MTLEVIKGLLRSPFYLKIHFLSEIYSRLKSNYLMQSLWRHKFSMEWSITFMLWRGCILFFSFGSSNLITTFTYILMDNFCPYFQTFYSWHLVFPLLRQKSYWKLLLNLEMNDYVTQIGLKLLESNPISD